MIAIQRKMNPRQERRISRISGTREIKQTFFIVCEGKNTEPDYFNAFRLTSATVKAVGKGLGTTELVKQALVMKNNERAKGRTYNQYWVVFDKDDFPDSDFNGAITLARSNGFEVAYSNQAFEYWFLLHFNLYQGSIHRFRYAKMLSDLLGLPYSKEAGVGSRMFNVLYPRLSTNWLRS